MSAIWLILVEFLFRLTFGVAVAMAWTSSRLVTSGFFRVHLWVLMGVNTFAALAVYSSREATSSGDWKLRLGMAVTAAIVSYLGAVLWMYEFNGLGKLALSIVGGCAMVALMSPLRGLGEAKFALFAADRVSGSLLLGMMTTAMLLGHWYLNTPTMQLAPLRRLILLLFAAIALRAAVSGFGAWLEVSTPAPTGHFPPSWGMFLSLRWLAGIVGSLVAAVLTWQTLKIPNTQSATGILYAGVIVAFIGELTAQLLSASSRFPL